MLTNNSPNFLEDEFVEEHSMYGSDYESMDANDQNCTSLNNSNNSALNTSFDNQIRSLRNEISNLHKQVDGLEDEISELNGTKDKLLSQLRVEREDYKRKSSLHDEETDELQKLLQSSKQRVKDVEEECRQLAREKIHLHEELDEKELRLRILESQLKEYLKSTGLLNVLQSDHEELLTLNASHEVNQNSPQTSSASFDKDNSSSKGESLFQELYDATKGSNIDYTGQRGHAEEMKMKLLTTEEENHQLKDELFEIRRTNNDLKDELDGANKKLYQLRNVAEELLNYKKTTEIVKEVKSKFCQTDPQRTKSGGQMNKINDCKQTATNTDQTLDLVVKRTVITSEKGTQTSLEVVNSSKVFSPNSKKAPSKRKGKFWSCFEKVGALSVFSGVIIVCLITVSVNTIRSVPPFYTWEDVIKKFFGLYDRRVRAVRDRPTPI